MAEWASAMLVEVDDLAARLGDPRLRVVDCRFSFDRDMRADYRSGHVPGAAYCNWAEDLSDPPSPVRWMLASPERFAATMSRLGVGDDTAVVAYDAEGGHHAARLWWALRYYGHDDTALLHGGIQAWVAAGKPLEPGEVTVPPARFTARARTGLRATKEEVLAHLSRARGLAPDAEQKKPLILDVRRRTEYTGGEVRAARGGHIPGARHLEWREALGRDWRLLPRDEVRAKYAELRIASDTAVITYCHAGVRAAFSAYVLTLLGQRDVKVYDGSWEEWGNSTEVPIER